MTAFKSTPICLGVACLVLLFAGIDAPSPRTIAARPSARPAAAVEPIVQDAGFGTIKGRLVWGGEFPPAPELIPNVNKDFDICAANPS